ncbi:hypothetical protein MICRO8M_70178 [Microbacterium sp. 8M]|nr:hypothetical protein MICRO8M_70178 [Microbacterium sp. 8M]
MRIPLRSTAAAGTRSRSTSSSAIGFRISPVGSGSPCSPVAISSSVPATAQSSSPSSRVIGSSTRMPRATASRMNRRVPGSVVVGRKQEIERAPVDATRSCRRAVRADSASARCASESRARRSRRSARSARLAWSIAPGMARFYPGPSVPMAGGSGASGDRTRPDAGCAP